MLSIWELHLTEINSSLLMPCGQLWYHDILANTLPGVDANEAVCVTGTWTKHYWTVWDLFPERGFTKLTCCEFTVGALFSINYNPVNAIPYVGREGCCRLREPRQYIQPWLARYNWGKCGPDTLPFTGRQRLHYANLTTRVKKREGERERGRKVNKKECEEETSARGREAVLWKWAREATVYMCGGEHVVISCM